MTTTQPPNRAARVAGNSFVYLASSIGAILIGFVVTPITLSHIGLVKFGLFEYVLTVVGLVTIVDPGFGIMVTRYTARSLATGELRTIGRLVSVAVLTWLCIGVLLSPVAFILIPFLVSHLHLTPAVARSARIVFYWGYGYIFLNAAVSTIGGVLSGIGQLWLSSLVSVVSRLLYAVVAVALLFSGFGLYSLVYASSAQVAVTFVAFVVAISMRVGRPFGNPFGLGRSMIKELVKFGGWTQLQGLFVIATYETDPLVIGTLISPAAVGIYSVADRLAQQIRFIPTILLTSLLPAAAELDATEGHEEELRQATIYGNRYTSLLSFSAAGLVVALSSVFFRVWLNHSYSNLEAITALLVTSYLLVSLSITGFTISTAMGRADLAAKLAPIGLVLNVALTLTLVKPLGTIGVLTGTVVSMGIWVVIYLRSFHRLVGLSSKDAVWSWLWKLGLVTAVATGTTRLILAVLPAHWIHHRTTGLVVLVAMACFYAAAFFLGLWLTRFVKTHDIEMVDRILPNRIAPVVSRRIERWMVRTEDS